jgi:hypothetical protein
MTAYSLPPFHRRGTVQEVHRHDEMNVWLWVTFDGDNEMTKVNVHAVASEALDQASIDTTLALNEGDQVEVEGVIIDGSHHARGVRLP